MNEGITPRRDVPVDSSGADVATLMESVDWTRTPLGAREYWPQSLKTSVSICLSSRFGLVILWGPELAFLYNDNYATVLGSKHPSAIGCPAHEVWPEVWPVIGPMLREVMQHGESTWNDDLLLLLERHGYLEECYFTFSYSPIHDESGGIGGVFSAVIETTAKVLHQRHLRTLRDLADTGQSTTGVDEQLCTVSEVLARNPWDVPFGLLYRLPPESDEAIFSSWTGQGIAPEFAPTSIHWRDPAPDVLSHAVAQAVKHGSSCEADLSQLRGVPTGAWTSPPRYALVIPIGVRTSQPSAILVCGINPHKHLDAEYRGFFELVANEISGVVGAAEAFNAERKRAEALADIDRAKTVFFTNISHEFRTPLTLILEPLADLAGDDLKPAQKELVVVAQRNARRLLRMVNTLLEFSRIEAGRTQARFSPVDLAATTADVAAAFRSGMERAGLRFTIDCPALSQPVWVDVALWEQVVLNLVSNAFKFTLFGEISIRLQEMPASVVLEVCDTGVGIPLDEQPHIFQRFFRGTQTGGRSIEGSGIGLALVRDLVQLHGGDVELDSQPAVGTCLRVRLPLGSAHLPADQLFAEPGPESSGNIGSFVDEATAWWSDVAPGELQVAGPGYPVHAARPLTGPDKQVILVVDDNADMRAALARALSPRYQVRLAANGRDALEQIHRAAPDLILADVMMPQLDGFDLLAAVRNDALLAGLPVILISARAGEDARVKGLNARADGYIAKPFRTRELLARVDQLLAMAALRRELVARENELRFQTERLQAAEALRASEERFRQLTNLSSDWYWEQDESFRFTYVSDDVKRYGRMVPGGALGKCRWELGLTNVHDLDWSRHRADLQARRPFRDLLLSVPRPEGGADWLLVSGEPFFDEQGVFQGYRGVGTDISERMRAQEALATREVLLKTLFDHSPGGLALLDTKGRFVRSNPVLCDLLGYAESELSEMTVQDLTHAGDRPEVNRLHMAMVEGRQDRFGYTRRAIRKNGSSVWTRITMAAVRGADGGLVSTVALVQDISRRRALEAARLLDRRALTRSERQQRQLAERYAEQTQRLATAQRVANVGSWETNLTDSSVLWSEQTYRIFEVDPAAFEPSLATFLALVHPHDRADVDRAFAAFQSVSGEHVIEHRLMLPGGKVKHVEQRWLVIADAAGLPFKSVGTTHDITERRRADERLANSQALLRMASKLSRLGAWEYDIAHGKLTWSDAVRDICEVPADFEATPENSLELIAPEYLDAVISAYDRCAEAGVGFDLELGITSARGRRVWLRVIGAAVSDVTGRIVTVQGAVQDITQRVAAEAALRESRQLLSRAQEITGLGYWEYIPDDDRVDWSEMMYRIMGVAPGDLEPGLENALRLLHRDDRARVRDGAQHGVASGSAFEYEVRVQRPDGDQRIVLLHSESVRNTRGEVVKLVGTCLDMTAHHRSAEQLLAMTRRLVETQESERRAIAAELHDRVGQNLTALSINLEIVSSTVERAHVAGLDRRLRDAQSLVEATSRTISDVMAELRPPMLDDYGLGSALDWYAEQFQRRTSIRTTVQTADALRAPRPSSDMALFRIAQEALNNVVKHAHAREVHVSLTLADARLVLAIRDDGRGFDPGRIGQRDQTRLGMRTMRERVMAIGGDLIVETSIGGGTTVRARVPA